MYNSHRGMVPAPNNRLTELLDQVRAEFDNQHNRTGEYEHQSRFDPSHDTVRASVQSMLAAKHGCVDGRLRHFICCVVGFLVIRPSYSRHEEVRVEQGTID